MGGDGVRGGVPCGSKGPHAERPRGGDGGKVEGAAAGVRGRVATPSP